ADAQLDLAECQRLLGRYAEAAEPAAALDQESMPDQTRLKARAELIRVAVARNDMAEVQRLIEQGRLIGGRGSPELDFAWLEAFVALARAAREGKVLTVRGSGTDEQAARFEQQAAEIAQLLAENYGPFWARRASQLLVAS